MTLGEYLARASGAVSDWGTYDCCTFGVDWTIECGWPDAMAEFRGRYATRIGALRIINRNGGFLALCQRQFASVGMPAGDPAAVLVGNIGLIRRPTCDRLDVALGIFTGQRWVTRAVRGIEAGPAEAIAIWRP